MENELFASWSRCWRGIGAAGDGAGLYRELLTRHSEPHRRYHTLQHLRECLAWLERVAGMADRPAEVETALWFHDAVYEPRNSRNEELCAESARATLPAAGVGVRVVEHIERLILITRHSGVPGSSDEQLIVNVDLAILGTPEPRFGEYEAQIREEYAFVPDLVFREKRSEILRAFLTRGRIYGTSFFFSLLEPAARRNLSRAVAALAGRSGR